LIINLKALKELAEIDFYEIVRDVIIKELNELRIILKDEYRSLVFIEIEKPLQLPLGKAAY
jgi:hypothetical protein